MKRQKEGKAFELSEVGLHLSANLTFEAVKPKQREKSEKQAEERRKKHWRERKLDGKNYMPKGYVGNVKKPLTIMGIPAPLAELNCERENVNL